MPVKIAGVGMLWLGIAWLAYASMTDPRGLLRRLAADYVAGMDADLRAMFLTPRALHIAWMQVTAALGFAVAFAMLEWSGFVALSAATALGPRVVITMMVRRRRARLDEQAHGYALALANTLKTTASLGEAIRFTLDVTAKPMHEEIETALREVRVGSTLGEALVAAAERAQSPALGIVVSALLVGQKTGGDLPRILEGTAASLRELKRLEELTDRVTRSSKQSLAVAASITGGLALMLPRVMPGFFEPLVTTTKGQLVAVQCVAVYLFALLLGWRFTRKSI